jgi:hypothetical protein
VKHEVFALSPGGNTQKCSNPGGVELRTQFIYKNSKMNSDEFL